MGFYLGILYLGLRKIGLVVFSFQDSETGISNTTGGHEKAKSGSVSSRFPLCQMFWSLQYPNAF